MIQFTELSPVLKGANAPEGYMKATVFKSVGSIELVYKKIPKAKPGEVIIKTTATTICGTDIHIIHGEHPVEPNRTLGHEHVGIVHEIGEGVEGINVGDRVMSGSCTPCGTCFYCQKNLSSQCIGPNHDFSNPGGWRLGNTVDGTHAEYFVMPYPKYNITKIPDNLTDEEVLLLTDIGSTGIAAAENAEIQIGDTVAVFACGPVGLCAIAGARLKGASRVIAIDGNEKRLELAKQMGADQVINFNSINPVEEILRITDGKGVDVAIEALGKEETFQNALKVIRRGGCISSVGIYSGHIQIPIEHFAGGMGDHRIITTLCPGGRERMAQLMTLVSQNRIDLTPMITHRYHIDDILDAYQVFENADDNIIKPIITF